MTNQSSIQGDGQIGHRTLLEIGSQLTSVAVAHLLDLSAKKPALPISSLWSLAIDYGDDGGYLTGWQTHRHKERATREIEFCG